MSEVHRKKRVTFADLMDATPTASKDAHFPARVDAHMPKDADAQQVRQPDASLPTIQDAHTIPAMTPESSEPGRPQAETLDARQGLPDAKPPTSILTAGVNAPTRRSAGVRKGKAVGVHKSDRHLDDREREHFRVAPDLAKRFRLFMAANNLEKQEFYIQAGVHFIECADAHNFESADANVSLDERRVMIRWKTNVSIINLYTLYNSNNKWKTTDDQEAQKYNDVDPRLIEMAIITTQFNAGFKRINSFKYYCTEIEEILAVPLANETIEIMLKQGRRRWSEASGK